MRYADGEFYSTGEAVPHPEVYVYVGHAADESRTRCADGLIKGWEITRYKMKMGETFPHCPVCGESAEWVQN